MSAPKVSQYSDPVLRFEDLAYNITPTNIDLDNLEDVILSISKDKQDGTLTILKYSEDTSPFTIDNTNKKIDVALLAAQLGDEVGYFWVNLWIVDSSKHYTHLSRRLEIVKANNFASS